MRTFLLLPAALAAALLTLPAAAGDAPAPRAGLSSAPQLAQPGKAPLLAAARAGRRIVAVGDYGIVVLSDDGRSFRQARSVPTRAPLTSVFFIDERQGWAAGHDGTVIATADGGETWRMLRQERGKERVLLSVWFENARHGLAVGQFGLALETQDGGATWTERKLLGESARPEEADRHLMQIFPGPAGTLFIATEAGGLLRSEDGGARWTLVQTDNKGSFWTGLALADGTLLAAGQRGHVYRSTDRGLTWAEVPSGTQQSITGLAQAENGAVQAVGLAGVRLAGDATGTTFKASVRPDRVDQTAIVTVAGGGTQVLSLGGVVAP